MTDLPMRWRGDGGFEEMGEDPGNGGMILKKGVDTPLRTISYFG